MQVEKVNKKPAVLEEKARVEDFIKTYIDLLSDNAEQIRAQQQKELSMVAQILAINNFSAHSELLNHKKLEEVQSVMTKTPSKGVTLEERIG